MDEPKTSVQHADELVASVIQRLAQVFADERNKLEDGWGKGDSVSTEDLRMALAVDDKPVTFLRPAPVGLVLTAVV